MKLRYLLSVIVVLVATTFFFQTNISDVSIPEVKKVQMGFPLPWIEATTDTVNGTTTYDVVWENLLINVAVYVAFAILIFA